MDSLDPLITIDGLKEVSFPQCRCFLHEDHRWILPIIHVALESGILPRPCKLVGFDAHHDVVTPRCIDEIKKICERGPTVAELARLCQHKLSKQDDDWLKAGMGLGLIADAAIFGVEDRYNVETLRQYTDHAGKTHRIELVCLPRAALNYQGMLSDLACTDTYSSLWEILGWKLACGNGFCFDHDSEIMLLDIDLDCFAVVWNGYIFPWPDEVFQNEFFTASAYTSTSGWTGRAFLDGLLKKAGLITITRESECCGGPEKAAEILRKTNHYLFDGKLGL